MGKKIKRGLVLTGGGARGAYQVGALLAVAEICKEIGVKNPFQIFSGSSAGAINAIFMASQAENFSVGVEKLKTLWESMDVDNIYKSNLLSLFKTGLQFVFELSLGGLYKKKQARALLDTSPLRELISDNVNFSKVQENIDTGILHGVSITTMNYTTGNSRIFVQGNESIENWKRVRRLSVKAKLNVKHILASSAIPILFQPVKIFGHYYGDGSLRNYTPLSPAVKMGADKVMVIGVRLKEKKIDERVQALPSLARILSMVLNSVLHDAIDLDYEYLERINKTIGTYKEDPRHSYKKLSVLISRPSMDIGKIALEEMEHLPKSIAYFLRGLGTHKEAADLTSFLLFEPSYTKRLIQLGYSDVKGQANDVKAFFSE